MPCRRRPNVPLTDVRRAAMLTGDLGATAVGRPRGRERRPRAASGSRSSPRCSRCSRSPRRTCRRPSRRISPAAVEWKLDGARIQMHRLGDEVRVFTRNLADVTDRVPEIVAAIRDLPLEAAVFDAEAIALRPDRRPHPFGLTMSRFGSRSRKDLTEFQTRVSAVAVRLRRAPSRRRRPDRPAGHRPLRRARRSPPGDAPRPEDRHRATPRRPTASSTTRSRAGTRA